MLEFCASLDVVRQRVASLRLTGRKPEGLAWAVVASVLRSKNSQASGSNGGAAPSKAKLVGADVRPASEYWTAEALAVRKRIRSEEVFCDAAYRWWSWIKTRTEPPAEPAMPATPPPAALLWMPVVSVPTTPTVKPTPSINKTQYKAVGVMLQQLVLRAMGLPEIAVSAGSDAFDWDGAWAADLKAGYASAVDVQWGLPRHTDTTVFDDHCFLTALFSVMELVGATEHPCQWSRMLWQLLQQAEGEEVLAEAAITHARNIHLPAATPDPPPAPPPEAPRPPSRSKVASPPAAAAAAGVQWDADLPDPAPVSLTLSFRPRKLHSFKRGATSMRERSDAAAALASTDTHPLSVLGSKSMRASSAYQPGILFGPPQPQPQPHPPSHPPSQSQVEAPAVVASITVTVPTTPAAAATTTTTTTTAAPPNKARASMGPKGTPGGRGSPFTPPRAAAVAAATRRPLQRTPPTLAGDARRSPYAAPTAAVPGARVPPGSARVGARGLRAGAGAATTSTPAVNKVLDTLHLPIINKTGAATAGVKPHPPPTPPPGDSAGGGRGRGATGRGLVVGGRGGRR